MQKLRHVLYVDPEVEGEETSLSPPVCHTHAYQIEGFVFESKEFQVL